MSIQEILSGSGGMLVVLMTIVQILPVKINPWTALANAIGRAVNADVLKELDNVKKELAAHVKVDDERNADEHRARRCV